MGDLFQYSTWLGEIKVNNDPIIRVVFYFYFMF